MAKPGVVATAHQHALARKARRSPRYVDDERQAVEDVLAALEAGLDAGTIGGDSEPGVELTFTCCKPDAVRRGLVRLFFFFFCFGFFFGLVWFGLSGGWVWIVQEWVCGMCGDRDRLSLCVAFTTRGGALPDRL